MARLRNSSGRTFRAALAALLLLAAVGTAGDGGTDPREAALAQIREEIATLQGQLARLTTKETGLEAELRRTLLELELQEKQLAEATAAYELAAARAAAAEVQVAQLEAALKGIREDLRRRLVGLYRLGRQGYLRLFLSLAPQRDLLPAIRQLRYLVRHDQMTLDRYVTVREELGKERKLLESQRSEMQAWKEQEAARRDKLVGLRRRQESLLEKVVNERRSLAKRAGDLQDKEKKLALFINSLVDENNPLEGTPIQEFRGVLDWPIQGRIVGIFGPRRDPRYNTEVPHNGIDIAIDGEGREIRAVYPGEVLFASEFEGYGLMVVVHHPGRTFTLYAGLGELRVAKGDVVSLGTVVGIGADQLYFEIRRENEAEDPLLWLR